MILVYHGSSVAVPCPDISFSRETLDFGKGFYLTPLKKQAYDWAIRAFRRKGQAFLNTYELADELFSQLSVKEFPFYDNEWLDFVIDNRNGKAACQHFDVLLGGVANDNVFDTLELFNANLITREKALERLRYEKPNKQICLCSQKVIELLLTFKSAEEVFYESK